ncbi:hypothetical protein BV898_05441 [Hypsibius exemplaris]|nr:hypothetical protein BV898_05441 [Hypsibius exemplaris]
MITSTNLRVNPLLSALVDLPYGAINLRGLLVLALFFYKRHSWHELARQTQVLLHLACPVTAINHLPRKAMTYLSGSLLFLTASGHVIFEAVEWCYTWNPGSPSATLPAFSAISTVPVLKEAYAWPFLTLYFCFSTVPFVLSQQVYVCAIVLARCLHKVLATLEQELLSESRRWEQYARPSSLDNLARKVATWEYLHVRTVLMVQAMNQFFGEIFLVTYLLDVLVAVCFATQLIGEETDHSLLFYFVWLGSFVLFGAYAMLLPLPFVLLNSQVPNS